MPDSFRALVLAYKRSPEFQKLSERTRYLRSRTYDEIAAVHGTTPLAKFDRPLLRQLRDARASTPGAANQMMKALRQLFGYGIEANIVTHNPARDLKYFASENPDGFHCWTVAEVEQYRAHHPVGSVARLAMELLLWTGVRRSDVVKLGPQMVRDGWLEFGETKGHAKMAKRTAIPILPPLKAVIDATPRQGLCFLLNAFGRPFTVAGFGNKMRDWCNAAGLPQCSAHGLRKAGATVAAENGASTAQLMAIYGWRSSKMAEHYTRAANRRKLAESGIRLLMRDATTPIVPNTGSELSSGTNPANSQGESK